MSNITNGDKIIASYESSSLPEGELEKLSIASLAFDMTYRKIVQGPEISDEQLECLKKLAFRVQQSAEPVIACLCQELQVGDMHRQAKVAARLSGIQSKLCQIKAAVTELQSKKAPVLEIELPPPKSLYAPVFQRRNSISLDDIDAPRMHDDSFNYIPASCLETGAALSILQDPGQAGQMVDQAAQDLAQAMLKIFFTELGDRQITVKNKQTTLKQMFQTILAEMHPTKSDQIGRCPQPELEAVWDKCAVDWLIATLNRPCTDENYHVTTMLSKVKALSAFGELLLAVGSNRDNKDILAALLGKSPEEVAVRLSTIQTQIRHGDFDSPLARARFEKEPIVDGQPISKHAKEPVRRLSGRDHGFGFGLIYIPQSKTQDDSSFDAIDEHVKQKYEDAVKKHGGVSGLPRQGSVIGNKKRPGSLTDHAHENMPEAFEKAGLKSLLSQEHLQFEHGIGMNRWQIFGTYPRQSWEHDLPAAGAHSGTTVEYFAALNCLLSESLFGSREATVKAGLIVSSFMVFGACHTFVETYPIAKAIAHDAHFDVSVHRRHKSRLYQDFYDNAQAYTGPQAKANVDKFYQAYRETTQSISSSPPLSSKARPSIPPYEV